MELEEFTTEGMVPFYGGSVKQPSVSHSEAAYGGKLEAFTGAFEHRPWGGKQPTSVLFQPSSQGPMNSSGRAVSDIDETRAAYLDTMPKSNRRANEVAPGMEKVLVGRPGVVGGTTGDVYYDSREVAMARGLAPTVDDLRAGSQPKVTYEGRMNPGTSIQAPGGARPAVMPQLAPMRRDGPLIREVRSTDDMIRTTGAHTAPVPRPQDYRNIKDTHRQVTSAMSSHFGTAGSASDRAQSEDRRNQPLLRQPLPQLPELPLGASTAYVSQKGRGDSDDHGRSGILQTCNNRDITTRAAPAANLVSSFKALALPSSDIARTTIKETMAENEVQMGNLRGGAYRTTTYFDPETGGARTSIKETTLGAVPMTNLRPGARLASVVYDPEDASARTSRKETTLSEAPMMGPNAMGGRGGIVYDPDDWRPAPTLKQMVTDRGTGNADGSIGGTNARAHTLYEGYDVAATQRDIAESERGTAYGGANGEDTGGYLVAQDGTIVRATHRENTSDHQHYGQTRAGVTAAVSYDAARMMRHDDGRENTLFSRVPTTQGAKRLPTLKGVGSSTTDGRQMDPESGIQTAAPTTGIIPPSMLRWDSEIRMGTGARPPPNDDERLDEANNQLRLNQSTVSAGMQRQNNPYVVSAFGTQNWH
jgi:hypothetical protein